MFATEIATNGLKHGEHKHNAFAQIKQGSIPSKSSDMQVVPFEQVQFVA